MAKKLPKWRNFAQSGHPGVSVGVSVSDEEWKFNDNDTFRSMTSGLPLSWVAPPPPAGILNITTKLRTMQSQRPN